MKPHIAKAALLSVTAASLLAASITADARAIRIDDDDGSGIWTAPVSSNDDSLLVGDIGFDFNFFGTLTNSLTIHAGGFVSFGGATISPFFDLTQPTPFSYSLTRDGEEATPGIPDALRIQWGTTDGFGNATTDNLFQLAIFDLTNDMFAIEFNYGQITAGSDDSAIGYNNGGGTSFDLLAELGLGFDDYMGIGANAFDQDNEFCEDPATILACNNFNAMTGAFGPDAFSVLPPDFNNFFRLDPTFGIAAQGRYFFLVDNNDDPNQVPEPGTLWLLSVGLAGLVMSRRRRTSAHIP